MNENFDFERDGVLAVPGAFDPSGMVADLWHGLASRHGVVPMDRSSWKPGTFGKLTRFGKSGRFASVATERTGGAVSSVLGSEWHEVDHWGQPLITFPMPGPWDVPDSGWHIDFPPAASLRAVRMFAYLSSVGTQGGGTLVITGSHRLAASHVGIRSGDLRTRLAATSEWFRELWRPRLGHDRIHRFLIEGADVEGVHVRVVELTGEPGDVVLWHPALLHTAAPNCSDQPRFMLTHTAYRGHGDRPST
jgi:hypothetical protein